MTTLKKKTKSDDDTPEQKQRQIVTIDTYDRINRRLRITRIVSALLGVAMLTFLCLYVYQLGAEKRTYRVIFDASAQRSATLMTEVAADPFDYDTKYREITAELGVMCQMAYRMAAEDEQQKAVNELYYAYIKLPNQVKKHLPELQALLVRIRDGDETAYADARVLIEGFDKQDL